LVKAELRVQPQEIAQLAATIKATTAKEQVTIVGELTHVDTDQKTFRMSVTDALHDGIKDKRIQGSYDQAITGLHPATLPRAYRNIDYSSKGYCCGRTGGNHLFPRASRPARLTAAFTDLGISIAALLFLQFRS
jgi:hypothetical protein